MISEEAQAIRQTFRITLLLTGAAFCITYLLADWIGFERPIQAGLIVMLACLTLLALGIMAIVLTERFCEVLEIEEPARVVPPPTRAKTLFTKARGKDDTLDLYLRRIYREVAPGDRSYIRKGGLGPARQRLNEARGVAATTAPAVPSGSVIRPVLSPRTEPYRTAPINHPKPYRDPRG